MINHIPVTQWFLLNVPTIPLCLLVVGISIILALLTVLFTAGAIPESKIGKYKGVTTLLFGGIIFLYSFVLVAIMATGWVSFNDANTNVEREASCLVELYRSADVFPKETTQEIHALLEEYAIAVINLEWRSLQKSELSNAVTVIAKKLWLAYGNLTAKNSTEQIFLQNSINKINELRECRARRLNDSQGGVYPMLWLVLIAGEMVTVSSISLFSEVLKARMVAAAFFAVIVGFIFFTILLLDFPFTGNSTVSSSPIKLAMQYW